MTLKKLSSKRVFAVCRTQLYQMRLLFILFGLVLALVPSLYTLGELTNRYWDLEEMRHMQNLIVGTIGIAGFAPMFGLGMGMAVQQFGYLHKRQKLDYFHAIPVLRAEHFLGRVLAAFVSLTAASVLVALGQIFAVGVAVGFTGHELVPFILWRCFWIVMPAFSAYLFTVLMIVLTATLWESVFSLVAVSALSPAVFLFASALITTSIPIHGVVEPWDILSVFSPLIFSVYYVVELCVMESHGAFVLVALIGLVHVLLCGGLSMWTFCRRRSEFAESNMPSRFKLVVRFSAIFCAAVLGSLVFLWITENYVAYWIGAVIGVVIGWLIMEILYTRSVRKAMRALWINGLSFSLFILINVLVLTGMIGIPSIPKAAEVQAVSVQYGKEFMNADMSMTYQNFNGNSEIVYTDEGQRHVAMATWEAEQIDAGVALAKAMLENQKDLYFPYTPSYMDGYSRYDVTYDMYDAKDRDVSYDVMLQLYVDGKVQGLSYGDMGGRGRIEELYDRARAISETEEYRMSNPSLVMMNELERVQYTNYEKSDEPEVFFMSDLENPEDFIRRLKEAYLADMYSQTKGMEYEFYEKYGGEAIENTTVEVEAIPTAMSDEYTLYLDPAAKIVLEGGILDSMYPAAGLECRLSPEYTKAFDRSANYWTDSTAIYFYRAEFPLTCAVLDELRAGETAE